MLSRDEAHRRHPHPGCYARRRCIGRCHRDRSCDGWLRARTRGWRLAVVQPGGHRRHGQDPRWILVGAARVPGAVRRLPRRCQGRFRPSRPCHPPSRCTRRRNPTGSGAMTVVEGLVRQRPRPRLSRMSRSRGEGSVSDVPTSLPRTGPRPARRSRRVTHRPQEPQRPHLGDRREEPGRDDDRGADRDAPRAPEDDAVALDRVSGLQGPRCRRRSPPRAVRPRQPTTSSRPADPSGPVSPARAARIPKG